MNIRDLLKKNPLVLAPMAGVTDKTFRGIVKKHNCGLLYTEMVSTKGLIFGSDRTGEIIDITEEQHPVTVQIFGNTPEEFGRVVDYVQKKGADFIDINMGCPAPKIVKNGEGAALLKDIEKAKKIIREVVKNSSVPVTVKIRKGWDSQNIVALEYGLMAESEGVSAIAIHGRTRDQFYSGKADWDIIKSVREKVKIPVIGNGDVFNPEDVIKMLEYTKCHGVMIGRGAMGNPWIFSRSYKLLTTGLCPLEPTGEEKIETALNHLREHVSYKGEYLGIRQMRKHLAWYLKGLPKATTLRNKINTLDTLQEVENALLQYKSEIKENL
jgi:tRNA-dihydrouridine synthase B